MTDFLIKKGLITKDNIKFVVYSSLSVPQDYFNEFIDYIYNIKDGYEKLKINCMIGSLKPKSKENFKTIAIGTDPNVIFYHYLRKNGTFVDNFEVDDTTYYHAMEKYWTKVEETETPIYNMTLELEIINLYELVQEVR